MKYIPVLKTCILCLLSAGYCRAQMPDSLRAHVDSSLYILKTNSLYASRVNWKDTERQVWDKARTAKTSAGTFAALQTAFDALGDKHAVYYEGEIPYRIDNAALMDRYTDSIKAAWSRGPRIDNRIVDGMAYISIPYLAAGRQEDIDKYANWVYDAVAGLQRHNPRGWIIDLRLNGGGNIRPMLAGTAMFFEDGIVGYYIDRDGHATDEAAFDQGELKMDGALQATIKNKIPYLGPAKVAVLIGPGTASSGEGLAAIFQQRAQTKLFGTPSAGLANATRSFTCNRGNSYFLISVAYLGDRHKKVLPEVVTPDVVVTGNDAFGDIPHDTVVRAAIGWLEQ